MKLQTSLLTAAAALLLAAGASAQTLVFQDIGTGAPTPGALDISQLSTAGTGADGQLNYYWDNGHQHTNSGAGNGYPGETFTTGANAAGYYITSLALKTDGNGGDTPTQPESFTFSIYQLSGTGNTNATLLGSYVASGTLAAEGDWIKLDLGYLTGTPVKLAPSTTYAYGFGITPGSPESWERLASATGTAFSGQICLVNVGGGTVTYSTNAAESVATFDLGLVSAATPPPAIPPLWTTNALATFVTNQIQWNYWGPGLTLSAGNAQGTLTPIVAGLGDSLYGTPETVFTNILEGAAIGGIDNYVDQFVGVFIPPVTTNYNFFLCSDDYSALYLSTDITASHAVLIAQENGWSNEDQWTTSGGGSPLADKRSDQFPGPSGAPQYPNGIPLVAGYSYFIELVHEQGGGGANDEATYSFAGAATPVNGSTTLITGSELGYVVQPPSYVQFTQQPANTSAYAGGEAAFSVNVSSDATPYVPAYQWITNGVNVTNADGTAANGQLFTYIVSSNDNNTKVQCAVTYPGATTNVYLSSQATLTVTPGTIVAGALKREFWYNEGALSSLTSGDLGAPAYVAVQTNGTGPTGTGISDYVERYSGWFIPPATGAYTFFVESDDYSDLFLSTDATPDSKVLIAQETGWANPDEWLTDNGGAVTTGNVIAQKSSATFIPAGGSTAPFASGISLTAGKMYYIEGDHDQGGGGDSFGMTFVLESQIASLTNYQPSAIGGTNIAYAISGTAVTNLTISQAPVAQTVFEGGNTLFQVSVATASQIEPTYTWYVGTNNLGTGAFTNLTSTLTLDNVSLAYNGLPVEVVITVPFSGLAITSTPVTLVVNKAVVVPGYLKMQWWLNNIGSDADIQTYLAGELGNPTITTAVPTFQAAVNDGIDNYLQVINGYFIPPETGLYVFNCCSDDQSELLLSTDDTAANLRLIAQVTSWDNEYQYVSSAGGSTISQKESDTWVPANSTTPPYAGGIKLTAGSNYFIEDIHYQGGGGDNTSVVFWTEDGNYTLPPDGTPPNFAPTNIAMLAPSATASITTNPVSQTVLSGTSATFTAAGATTSQISVDDVTDIANPSYSAFQWYTNGVAVPGATGSSYTTPLLGTNDSGDLVYVAISAIGAPTSNSSIALITVKEDTTAPALESAFYVLDSGGTGGEPTNAYVDVTFSKPMSPATVLNAANYTITGATITGVILFTNGYNGTNSLTQAILQLAQPLKNPNSFTLTTSGLQSFSGVATTNTSIAGANDPLTSEDIALGGIEVPGETIYNGPGSYTVNASGYDIWNAQDSFRFVYTTRTNNFDIVVQVAGIDPANQWTKAGLMARETIDPTDGGSRMISVEATASTKTSPPPLDGSTAENSLSTGWRSVTDTAAFNGAAPAPGEQYSYIGDGSLVPVYPNDAWIRLTRTGYGTTNDMFTGYGSTNGGLDWVLMCTFNPEFTTNNTVEPGVAVPTNSPFPSVVYVGMCTTAHEPAETDTYVATAYYQNFGDYVASTNTPPSSTTLTATRTSATTVSVSWTPGGGSLYSSSVLTTNASSWTLVGTNNPATITIGAGTSEFYEVQ